MDYPCHGSNENTKDFVLFRTLLIAETLDIALFDNGMPHSIIFHPPNLESLANPDFHDMSHPPRDEQNLIATEPGAGPVHLM